MPKSKSRANGNSNRRAGKVLGRKDDSIQWFQRQGFDPAEFIGLLNSENELEQARNELAQLSDYCKQEVQKVVHAHHKDFLEASRDIQDVEVLVDELRNYVSGSVAVVGNLVDLPSVPKQGMSLPLDGDVEQSHVLHGKQAPTTWESILSLQAELMQDLQVAVAEREVALARALLGAGRDMIAVIDKDGPQIAPQAANSECIPGWRYAFEGALAGQKAILIEELQRQLLQTNSSTLERRLAAQNLGLIVGPSQATQALLGCHSLRVRAAQQYLLKQHSAAGGDPDGVEYAGGLAQRTFLAIGAAAEDARAVFPSPVSVAGKQDIERHAKAAAAENSAGLPVSESDGQAAAMLPPVSALVVQWASDEARHCAALLCRHALTPFVPTGMAIGALLCVGLALVFCVALEPSHGLALRAAFMEELWPLLEAILRRHLHRLHEEASAAASVDATNAALRAVAGSGAAYGASMAGGNGAVLSGIPGSSGRSSGLAQPPAAISGFQEELRLLFLGPDLQPTAAAPAGLTCLNMLVPELKALAEGLAPLTSGPAVTVLRQGVLSIFETVCEKVHASLLRLVANNAGTAGTGKNSATHDSLLAAYVVRAEKVLRMFAESDLQAALEPLAYVCGPVTCPELLLPSLAPLNELLTKLPEPAPETTEPAESTPKSDPLQQQQSMGLLDRIKVELEADQGRRDQERDVWMSGDARGQAEAGHAVSAAPANVFEALDGGELPGSSGAGVLPRRNRESRVPVTALHKDGHGRQAAMKPADSAATLEETVLEQVGDEGVLEASKTAQQKRHASDAQSSSGRQGTGDEARPNAIQERLEKSPMPRRPQRQPQRPGDLRAGDSMVVGAAQVEGMRKAGDAAGREPPPQRNWAAMDNMQDTASDRGEDQVPSIANLRSRSTSRDGEHRKSRAPSDAPLGDAVDNRIAGLGLRHLPDRQTGAQLERSGDSTIAGTRSTSRRGGHDQAADRQLEAYGESEMPDVSRGGGEVRRRRQGLGRAVRFQEPPTQVLAPGGGEAPEDAAPGRRPQTAKPERVTEAPQQASLRNVRSAWGPAQQQDEEHDGTAGDDLTAAPPARKVRPRDRQPVQAAQLAVRSRSSPLRDDGAEEISDADSPPRQMQTARRELGLEEREASRSSGTTDNMVFPGTRHSALTRTDARILRDEGDAKDEEWPQQREMCRVHLKQAGSKGNENLANAATVANIRTAPVPMIDGEAGSGPAGVSIAAAPRRARYDPSDGVVKQVAGGALRKPNRFGVVLSDDDDEPVVGPRLRRPRAVGAGAACTPAVATCGHDAQQSRGAEGSSALLRADIAAMAAAPEDSSGSELRTASGTQEESGNGMVKVETLPASRRAVAAKGAVKGTDETVGVERRDQEPSPVVSAGPISVSTMDVRSHGKGPRNDLAGGAGVGAAVGRDGAPKPQTARERLAARMAAKGAALDELL